MASEAEVNGASLQSAGTSGQAFIATISDMKQMIQQLVPIRTTNTGQVLLLACAEDLECVPGFQQKVFYIEKPFQFTEDQLVLNCEASTEFQKENGLLDVNLKLFTILNTVLHLRKTKSSFKVSIRFMTSVRCLPSVVTLGISEQGDTDSRNSTHVEFGCHEWFGLSPGFQRRKVDTNQRGDLPETQQENRECETEEALRSQAGMWCLLEEFWALDKAGINNVQVWLRDRCNAMDGKSEEADKAETPQSSPECLAGKVSVVSARPSSLGCVAAPGACYGQLKYVKFDDCKGNNQLNFEVSNPNFTVELDGNLVALKNVSEVGKALFVHARSEHAEDMAEIFILEANEKRGALKEILKLEGNLGIPRQKRAILATPILIPENQRPPFPRLVGKVIRSEGTEGVKFRLSGKGVDQDPKGIFRINEMNGDVSVTRTLDREAIANYEVSTQSDNISASVLIVCIS
ncbi:hypothetical protein IHE44_0002453 [Lamprotornis superbus]|uniref:Cadherin-13 n=1 Tax=Lamprotornis superbus TaxID=245042 RepID=A0A835TTV4_9PASS|nr:hypothetical protein IHE44_0002453 [Lamprotornis superbus]